MKINKNIILYSALIVTMSIGVVKPCLALNTDYVPMDGAIQEIKTEKMFEVKGVVNKDTSASSFTSYPFKCTFSTLYSGTSGVEVNVLDGTHPGIIRDTLIVYSNSKYIFQAPKMVFPKEPFQTPVVKFINQGCSVYKDGDTCKTGLERPSVFVSCITQN